jgi:hypothetical protein
MKRTTIPARIFAQSGNELDFVVAEELVAMVKSHSPVWGLQFSHPNRLNGPIVANQIVNGKPFVWQDSPAIRS